MDLSKMSRDELASLQKQVAKELENRERREKEEAIRKIQQIAQDAGIDLGEVAGSRRRRRSTSSVKYRDPNDPSNTWAGRGRKPRWLEEQLKKGRKLEEFAV